MMTNKDELNRAMADAVVEMEDEETTALAEKYTAAGFDPLEGLTEGLAVGMKEAGDMYEKGEYFIPELLLCSEAFYSGAEVLHSHIKTKDSGAKKMTAVVGVVEGDTHDIGKNILKIMLESEGFEVFDLGRDVPPARFVEVAKEKKADFIGLATLMTTTMNNMKVVIDLLKKENIRDQVVVMVGGGPISRGFAERIGADGYEKDAATAAKVAKEKVMERRNK